MTPKETDALIECLNRAKASYHALQLLIGTAESELEQKRELLKDTYKTIKAIERLFGEKGEKKGDVRKGPSFRFEYKGVPLLQADLVRSVVSDAAARMSFTELKKNFPGVDIVAESSRNQRRLFATLPEWESFSPDYKVRYFPETLTATDGVVFKLWSDFGRYIPLPDGRKKEGFTYKFIRFANKAGFQITPLQKEPHAFID